ncbi:lanthionine synthetase C family protein [Allokutzneria albata]|uniref:Lanthionine synthetase C-like protein n=1 Tax=Allokutzneria albata TaxID=211114 RepID=A0A1G9V5K3_ALLAB|nr:lanthionine synthetase C family protein [Allokutzneria albata]SDM67464.1 Lanthionine synthetase C-like protein [Allokutzneria albata]
MTPALADRARETAWLILTRLADPAVVADAVAASRQRANHPFDWGGPGLFTGLAGSAVAFQAAHRAFPAEAAHWRGLAHQQLVAAAQASFSAPLSHCGISAGTSGLAFAFADSLREEPRYGATLDKLNTQLAAQVIDTPTWRSADGVRDSDYDVISGAAGTLGYLISVDAPKPVVRQAIDALIDDLVWLCDPERWFIPPHRYPLASYSDRYPHGYVNIGLAHGIPGPLAALSLAHQAGYQRDGLVEAIRRTADYLVGLPCWWPAGVPLTESGAEDRDRLEPGRIAWCYGAPGVAAALLNAANALQDKSIRDVAVDGFESVLRNLAPLPEAPLCHGVAGLLPICALFAEESTVARKSIEELTEHVLSHCDEDAPLVVRGDGLDDPSLLTGSAGVALALLTATGDVDNRWTRALLLA